MSCMGCANMDAGVPQVLLALTVKLDCSDNYRADISGNDTCS